MGWEKMARLLLLLLLLPAVELEAVCNFSPRHFLYNAKKAGKWRSRTNGLCRMGRKRWSDARECLGVKCASSGRDGRYIVPCMPRATTARERTFRHKRRWAEMPPSRLLPAAPTCLRLRLKAHGGRSVAAYADDLSLRSHAA
ncbi:hypothetical protein DFH11DRAFT_1551315 [Phellopilus nigrolimitatus]|nr:hypothetical protein DFH11DRAFT_1551315 [Phellopilus nigrolimitatus]